MAETIDVRRKRLAYQSRRRGVRELDLLLGRFADACLARLTPDQLDRYEALLGNTDLDLLRWIGGIAAPPAAFDNDVLNLIKSFKYKGQHTTTLE